MAKPLAVLIVEDSDSDAQLIVRMLTKAGYTLTYERVETAEQMRSALQNPTWEVVISDFSMPELDGNAALKVLQETGLDIPFIVVSGTMGEDTAVAMMKAGAHDYLMKGKLARLVPAVERELQQAEERRERKQAEESLRESEKRFSTIFHANPAATALTCTSDNRLIEVSESWQKLTGYSRSEAVGHTGNELNLWVETKVREQMIETLRQQGWARCETKILCKSGEIRDVLMSADIVELAGEHYLLTMAQDITERKQAERFNQAFINNNPMSIQVLDKDGFTLETNPAFRLLFGSVPPSGYSIFNDLQLAQKGVGLIFDQLRNGEVIHLPDTKFNPHDSISELPDVPVWVRTIGFPIFDNNDKPVRFILVHEDITERKQAEKALHESQAILQAALDNSPAGIAIADAPYGKLRYVNDAGLLIRGGDRKSIVDGVGIDKYVSSWQIMDLDGQPLKPDEVPLARAILFGEANNREFIVRRSSEDDRIVLGNAAPILDESGKVTSAIVVFTDITERKQAELIQDALYRLAQAADQSESLDALYPAIHAIVKEIMTADNFYFAIHDENHDILSFPYFVDQVVSLVDPEKSGKSLTAYVFRTAKPLLCDKSMLEELNQRGEVNLFGAQSEVWLGVPLLIDGKAIGVMAVQDYKNAIAYGKRELRILEFVSSQVAIAIHRKQAEQTLIQANNRLSLAQRSSRAGVWDWNIVNCKLDWSPEFIELLGLDVATVPTFDVWRSVLHPEDVQAAGDKIDQAIREHKPLSNEYRIVLPSGEIHWINAMGDTIYDDQGEPQRMTGMCIDITERKLDEQKIQRQFDHLASLSAIDRVVTTNFDLSLILAEILAQTTKELDVDAVDILLLDPVSGMLEFAAKHGFNSKSVNITQLRMGESYAGRAALERKVVHIPDLRSETDTKLLAAIAAGDNFISYFGVPLINKGKVSGVLEVFHRTTLEPDTEWFDFLNSLAGQAAIAIENASLYESQQRTYQELTLAYDATIEGWSHALDLRDKETEGHSLRVTDLTLKLAGAFGLNNDELIQMRWGALLHDIGKMGVPDGILLKPGPLTDEEWVVMRKHPSFAYEMLSPIHYLRQALDIPYSHHEKWDGSGYPQGLKGKQIPLSARIFAVVDVWDALRSDRPYRSAWSDEKAYNHIRSLSGTHFDPQVVEKFFLALGKMSK
jgi:PAS domain S-box-containing protein/putative nucleotidyltransferase with HDIG domain